MMTVKGRWHEATKLVSYLEKKQLGIANFPSLFTRDIHTKRFGKASLTMSGSGKRSDLEKIQGSSCLDSPSPWD